MKIKCLPEDFIVHEQTNFPLGSGPYAVYELEKEGLGTPEAVDAILHRWNLPRQVLQYCGLKDRHAHTFQRLTIRNGPKRGFQQEHLHLKYLGQAARPLGPADLLGNRFTIVLRDLGNKERDELLQAVDRLRCGVPNYFDDQRFGSLGESNRWIAVPWCKGDYGTALWLALAEPNSHDRPEVRQRKQLLRDHWGNWSEARAALDRSHERSIVVYLCDHPSDFRGALARVRQDLRSLYLSAFQSMLWNRLLAATIVEQFTEQHCAWMESRIGPVPVPNQTQHVGWGFLEKLKIPLPAARQKEFSTEWETRLQEILEPLGMERRELRVKYPRDAFFSKGHRPALTIPRNLEATTEADDRYRGKSLIRTSFELPSGAYATLLLKCLRV
jgi:tRNA pseudouridine13 synthase